MGRALNRKNIVSTDCKGGSFCMTNYSVFEARVKGKTTMTDKSLSVIRLVSQYYPPL
jgi:hypothetical protein